SIHSINVASSASAFGATDPLRHRRTPRATETTTCCGQNDPEFLERCRNGIRTRAFLGCELLSQTIRQGRAGTIGPQGTITLSEESPVLYEERRGFSWALHAAQKWFLIPSERLSEITVWRA